MATSSILGGERASRRAPGRDADALGPSDSSDSGSDVQGERAMPTEADNPGELGALPVRGASDSDARGTGERGSATGDDAGEAADILPDHLVSDPYFTTNAAGRRLASDDDDVDELALDPEVEPGDEPTQTDDIETERAARH